MKTAFPSIEDINLVYLQTKDWCNRHYPELTYRIMEIPEGAVDPIHDEIRQEDKRWKNIEIRGHVIPAEQMFPLTPFGIEELRDLVIQISVPNLIEVGLATQDKESGEITLLAKTGDRFYYSHGVEYEILLYKIGAVFGNTDIPTFYFASAEKVRMDSTIFQDL